MSDVKPIGPSRLGANLLGVWGAAGSDAGAAAPASVEMPPPSAALARAGSASGPRPALDGRPETANLKQPHDHDLPAAMDFRDQGGEDVMEPFTVLFGTDGGPAVASTGSSAPPPALPGPRLVFLDTNTVQVNEDTPAGAVDVVIRRTGPLDGVVDVTYRTIAVTATDGADYTGVNATVRFEDGESEKTITIAIANDALEEGPERFNFVLELAVGAALGVPRTANVVIADDDDDGDPPPPPVDGESYGFAATLTTVLTNLDRPVGIAWLPDDPGTMLLAEQSGVIWVVQDGVRLADPLLDIRAQVNFVGDRGLMHFALDPEFATNPYLYVAYVYDPPEVSGFAAGSLAGPDGAGNRPARVSRFEVSLDVEGNPSTIPGSEVVLVGTSGTWANISGPGVNSTLNLTQAPSGIDPVTGVNLRDYIAVDSLSHAPGTIQFGPDGHLYVSIGDGTSFNALDARALRVQDVDNLSGKVLRVDRLTGQGLADNPFWDGDAGSNASKVYQLGLRNGFRMEVDDQNGQVWIGDVGWFLWERLLTGDAGANFGWPFYEGGDGVLLQQPGYSALPEAAAFFADQAAGLITVTAPYRGFAHNPAEPGPQFAAIILGEIYRDDLYPDEFANDIFFADFLSGTIYTMDVADPDRTVRPLTQALTPTQMSVGPDGRVYVVSNFGGTVQRLDISDQPAEPPPALPQVTFSNAATPNFQQDRSDSFTTLSPLPGQFRQLTPTELDIAGVAPNTDVQMVMTTDNLLLVGSLGGSGSVKNLFVTDPDGVNLFAALFRDVEVLSTGGPNLVIVDGTQRGRVTLGEDADTLVVSLVSPGSTPLGPANTFTADLGAGNDSNSIETFSASTRVVVDAGLGNDTVVVQGPAEVRLTGGEGNDIMVLGTGEGTLVVRPGDGQDIVGNFTSGIDVIEFVGVDPATVTFQRWVEGGGTIVRYGTGDDRLALVQSPFAQFSQADFVFT